MSDETHIPVLSTRLHSGHSFPASFPKILRSIPGLNAAIAAGARTLKSDNAVIAAVSVTTVLSSYFNGCIGILLPAIQLDLDISNANLVWPASLYSLITACFLLVSGRLSGESHDLRSLALTLQADVYGRRLLFLVGTSIFALLSLAIALSSNFISLTVFTALLGFGPAAFTPAGTGILGSNLPPGKKKNIAFAILGAGQVLGYLGGLLLSSGFADNWRGAFYLQFGLASAALLLACLALPKNQEVLERDRSIDWIGALLITSALILLCFALLDSQAAPKGWLTPYILAFLPISALLFGLYFYHERRVEKANRVPLTALSLFKAPHFTAILVIAFLSSIPLQAIEYWMNLYLQIYKGYSAFQTAVFFIPDIAAGAAFSIVCGYLLSRVHGLWLLGAGMITVLPASLLFALIQPNLSYFAMVFPCLILLAGPDFVYTVGSVQVSKSADDKHQSMAGALFGVALKLATALGLALTSSIANGISDTRSDAGLKPVSLAGYRGVGWACTAIAGLASLVAVTCCRHIGVVGKEEGMSERAIVIELESRPPH